MAEWLEENQSLCASGPVTKKMAADLQDAEVRFLCYYTKVKMGRAELAGKCMEMAEVRCYVWPFAHKRAFEYTQNFPPRVELYAKTFTNDRVIRVSIG